MRRKTVLLIFVLGSLSFFMFSCATIRFPGDYVDVRVDYENLSLDKVWDAAILAVQDVGFIIKTLDKDSGLIYAEMKMTGADKLMWGVLAQDRQMNITIRETSDNIFVQIHELTRRKTLEEGFFKALDARLGVKRVGFNERQGKAKAYQIGLRTLSD